MVMDNEKNTYLFLWQMRYVTIPFGADAKGGEPQVEVITPLYTPMNTRLYIMHDELPTNEMNKIRKELL